MKFLLILALLVSASLANTPSATETFSQSYPMSSDGTIRLENLNGLVEIIGWDRNEVHVEAVKTAPKAEDLASIEVRVDASYNRIAIKTAYDKKLTSVGVSRGDVRYILHVPADIHLEEIGVVNSEIRVRDVTGPVNLKTVNGRIEATGLAGSGRFESINGSVSAAYSRLTGIGALSFRTVNGRCDLTVPKGAVYHISSKSVNGGVRADTPVKMEKSASGLFSGSSGSGGPEIDFNSVNGELAIHTK
jgi:hypothetical protein